MKTRIPRQVALANGRGSERATWRWRVEQLSAVDVGRALAWLAAGSRVAIDTRLLRAIGVFRLASDILHDTCIGSAGFHITVF